MSDRCSEVLSEVRRSFAWLMAGIAKRGRQARLLDIGCWDGSATIEYAALLGAAPHGIEIFPEPAAQAERRGVAVARLDLETERFPWADGWMDVVVANQVFEHLKNVWLPLSEAFRVTRVGGWVILAVPNLASFHNRVLLSFGQQPTCIRTRGPHVRAFTLGELRRIVERENFVTVERAGSVGFYPFPSPLARLLTRLWPGGGHTAVIVARKIADTTHAWGDVLSGSDQQSLQTFYGPAAAAAPASAGSPPVRETPLERRDETTVERVR